LMGPPSPQHEKALGAARAIADVWGVSLETLMGFGRAPRLCAARELSHYAAHELTGLPYTHLAVIFDRDHSTILCACARVRRRIAASPEFGHFVDRLLEGLRGQEDAEHTRPC